MGEPAFAEFDDYQFDNEPDECFVQRNPMPDMLLDMSAWCERNAQLRAAWIEWRARMSEISTRKHRGAPPPMFWARNARRFRDTCRREYGAEVPEPEFIGWRNRRLEELGRGKEAENGRQPWD